MFDCFERNVREELFCSILLVLFLWVFGSALVFLTFCSLFVVFLVHPKKSHSDNCLGEDWERKVALPASFPHGNSRQLR